MEIDRCTYCRERAGIFKGLCSYCREISMADEQEEKSFMDKAERIKGSLDGMLAQCDEILKVLNRDAR